MSSVTCVLDVTCVLELHASTIDRCLVIMGGPCHTGCCQAVVLARLQAFVLQSFKGQLRAKGVHPGVLRAFPGTISSRCRREDIYILLLVGVFDISLYQQ